MILFGGKQYPSSRQAPLIARLGPRLLEIRGKSPDREALIKALDTLARRVEEGAYDLLLDALDLPDKERRIREAAWLLKEEQLRNKLATELPPLRSGPGLKTLRRPLGVLFHIAAGNIDALPAYSVVEGLLAGNINILKLPGGDQGLTVTLLEELIKLCPEAREYIYVFDTPSQDLEAMKALAALADGIVVWGSEEAVGAARQLAPINCRLIEWGHKLSFAYLSRDYGPEELKALATHIRETRQLLCSSAQLAYLDTDSREELEAFCRAFLPLLEEIYGENDFSRRGKMGLQAYTNRLEQALGLQKEVIFQGKHTQLKLKEGRELEASDQFGSLLVKGLPREEIIEALSPHKSRLQTVGLGRMDEDLAERFAAAGLTRITRIENMARPLPGENHDGLYALAAYTRLVDVEK